MVLDRKTNFFPGKRWFWGRKTNFFLGKRWFWAEKPTFSKGKEKRWFGAGKPNFFLGKTKQTIILDFGRIVSQKIFFFGFFGFP